MWFFLRLFPRSFISLTMHIFVILSVIISLIKDRLVQRWRRVYFKMLYIFEVFNLLFCFFLFALGDILSEFNLQPRHDFFIPRSSINPYFSFNFSYEFPKFLVIAFLSIFHFISKPNAVISHQFYLTTKDTRARIDQREKRMQRKSWVLCLRHSLTYYSYNEYQN